MWNQVRFPQLFVQIIYGTVGADVLQIDGGRRQFLMGSSDGFQVGFPEAMGAQHLLGFLPSRFAELVSVSGHSNQAVLLHLAQGLVQSAGLVHEAADECQGRSLFVAQDRGQHILYKLLGYQPPQPQPAGKNSVARRHGQYQQKLQGAEEQDSAAAGRIQPDAGVLNQEWGSAPFWPPLLISSGSSPSVTVTSGLPASLTRLTIQFLPSRCRPFYRQR